MNDRAPQATVNADALAGLALLRKPFSANQISQLPKPYKKDSPKGKCPECGGYHALPAMHLDYVGHAALTDRLLDADPMWTWEPMAVNGDGSPHVDNQGGMWIKLTVCGVTRIGYGDAQGKIGPNAVKEVIGDALRNAAMRFGAALDLWHKGDLHGEDDGVPEVPPPPEKKEPTVYPVEQFAKNLPAWRKLIQSGTKTAEQIIATVSSKAILSENQKAQIKAIKVPEGAQQ